MSVLAKEAQGRDWMAGCLKLLGRVIGQTNRRREPADPKQKEEARLSRPK